VTLELVDIPLVATGQNETFQVSLTNELATSRNVNYTGAPTLPYGLDPASPEALDYVLPLQPACGYPSSPSFEPAFVVVYNESGSPLLLSDAAPSALACVSNAKNYYEFSAFQTLSENISVGGYWTSPNPSDPWTNATYHQFSPGVYTVVAFDPWEGMIELNFTVAVIEPT
jgi:hypothetical protein